VARVRRRFGSGGALVAALALGVAISGGGAGAGTQSPGISVAPGSASPMAVVTVSGNGYLPGETVTITLNTTVLATVTASSQGVFSAHVRVPTAATPGQKTIHATGSGCGCSAQTPFTVVAEWLQLQNTATHLGVQAHESALSTATVPGLTLTWAFGPSCSSASESISVWNDLVFTDNDPGGAYALDAKTGAVVWNSTARAFGGSPAVGDGAVFYGGRSRVGTGTWVTALDPETGAVEWNTKIGDHNLNASPVVASGRVFIGTGEFDDHFYALDAATGAVVWSKHLADGFFATATVANGVVYAGLVNGRLYAWKAATGARKWVVTLPSVIDGPAAAANGVVYIHSDGVLYALSAATGLPVWSKPVPSGFLPAGDSPVVSGGTLYVSAGAAGLIALSASNGATLWTTPLSSDASYAPALANGVVYVATDGSNEPPVAPSLYAADASNGAILFSVEAGQGGSPSVADGEVYETGTCALQAFGLP
jgi:outer membrane protein assembly factor BamB